ncbi:class II glutamine amidotransferase [Candidatus Spongiihabitans sp.]|uniref:class II glutamine amidotransferase n=1 Tax=Candidatus Spongiihabitans sp. TaxID=3101308 RepID=UPI003C7A2BC7
MCGIVGLYIKSPELEANLGGMLSDMLMQMTERGPDSAGFAIYRNPVASGQVKITLQSSDADTDWEAIQARVQAEIDPQAMLSSVANHGVLIAHLNNKADNKVDNGAETEALLDWVENNLIGIKVTSVGYAIEIYKEKGSPDQVIRTFGLNSMAGTHALGHTRMATESAVTTEHSHPFSTGRDLCLVHNGSLSNHNNLREMLIGKGIRFTTDNDSEVAAGYLTWRLGQGATLNEALEAALADLDGFYTFAIGAKDGFAVLRDPIACKPAILAETDDWVAMASEYRAIAQLPGSENATIWEPEPATIYSWNRS